MTFVVVLVGCALTLEFRRLVLELSSDSVLVENRRDRMVGDLGSPLQSIGVDIGSTV